MVGFRTLNINLERKWTEFDYQKLCEVLEKANTQELLICGEMWIDRDNLKRVCNLLPHRMKVNLKLGEKGRCYDVTFSPDTNNINMDRVVLYSSTALDFHYMQKLFCPCKSWTWTVSDKLYLAVGPLDVGPRYCGFLSKLLQSLDNVLRVRITEIPYYCNSLPEFESAEQLEPLWNKTRDWWEVLRRVYDGWEILGSYSRSDENGLIELMGKHFNPTKLINPIKYTYFVNSDCSDRSTSRRR